MTASTRARAVAAALVVVVGSPLLTGLGAPVVGAAAASAPPKPPIGIRFLDDAGDEISSWGRTFSPNGDGKLDKARYTISMHNRAKVKVNIVRGGELIKGPIRLGEHRSGTKVKWTWAGRDNDGTRVPDGSYGVIVIAKTGADEVYVAKRTLNLDTVFLPKDLVVHADTVYPRTKVVYDRLWFRLRYPADFGRADSMTYGTLRITTSSGKLVFSKYARNMTQYPRFWDGHDNDGDRVPAGKYWARVRAQDYGMNSGQTRRIPVYVSDERLVLTTGTATVNAVDSYLGDISCEGSTANGCGDFPPCGDIVASTTYPAETGALSYRSSTDCAPDPYRHRATASHTLAPLPSTPRGLAVSKVTMRGKPTVAGETDTMILYVGGASTTSAVTTEETLTSVTAPPVEPQTLVWAPRSVWTLATTGEDSYDVADFVVEYVYLAPR